jgi:O-antigen/teichoic acid export membrane protein
MLVTRAQRGVRSDLVRNGGLVFAATMAANVANYGLHLLLVRQLGVVGYGTVSALLAIVTIVAVIGVVAGTAITNVVARARALHDAADVRTLADKAVLGSLGAALLLAAIAFAGHAPLAAYLHVNDTATIAWASGLLGVSVALPALRGVYQGAERYVGWGLSIALEAIGRLAVAVPLVVAGFATGGAVAGLFAGSAIALVLSIGLVPTLGPRVTHAEMAPRLIISATTAWAVLLITTFQVYDLILAKHYLSPLESGFYIAAGIAGRVLFTLVSTVPIILLPKTARASSRGSATVHLLFTALAATALIAGVCLAAIALAPGTVAAALAGPAARGAGAYVLEYGIATTCIALASVVVTYRIGTNDMRFVPQLAVVLALECAGLLLFHRDAREMLVVLMAGHAAAIAAATIGIRSTTTAAA